MRALALCLALCATVAQAGAPQHSLRPVARPGSEAPAAVAPAEQMSRPKAREQGDALSEGADKPQRKGLFRMLRPQERPKKLRQKSAAARAATMKGAVCGDPALKGEAIGPVPGKIRGCGVAQAVRLRSVAGVRLSQPAVMDCTTAKTLKTWVEKGAQPAVGGYGGGLSELYVMASYACRTRNSQKGAKISEHGKGRAIDIGGYVLRDGKRISVLKDWGKGRAGRILAQSHKSACGPFGTVLGPKANKFHRDHFHFDTARYRSGSYCR